MAAVRVNLVLDEIVAYTALVERLSNYANRSGEIVVTSTEHPVHENETDCYVISIDRVRALTAPSGRPPTWKPVIATGPPAGLKKALLEGCADYLREPWNPDELHFRAIRNCRTRTHRFPWGSIEIEGTVLVLRFATEDEPPGPARATIGMRQTAILEALLALRGTPVGRDLLFYAMWGRSGKGSRAVDAQVHALRETMGEVREWLGGDGFVRSVYGAGYLIP